MGDNFKYYICSLHGGWLEIAYLCKNCEVGKDYLITFCNNHTGTETLVRNEAGETECSKFPVDQVFNKKELKIFEDTCTPTFLILNYSKINLFFH